VIAPSFEGEEKVRTIQWCIELCRNVQPPI